MFLFPKTSLPQRSLSQKGYLSHELHELDEFFVGAVSHQ